MGPDHPWQKLLLFEVLRIIIFYPTLHHAYRVAVLAAMIHTAAHVCLAVVASPLPVSLTLFVGTLITFAFARTTCILCAGGSFPDHWRRVRDELDTGKDADGLKNLPSNFPFTRKLLWMLDLAYNPRMIGWVDEPRDHLPPHPPPSRSKFLRKVVLNLIVNYVQFDFSTLVLAQSPAFDSRVHDPSDGPETYLAAVPFLRRANYIRAHFTNMSSGLAISQNLLAFVCVGLAGSSPTLWPDIWGRWGDAYTVRRLWGRSWHQLFRPTLSGLGKLVANKILKLPRGTNVSSYTQLYVGFFVLGLIHQAGDSMFEKRIVYRSLNFFLLQAAAITFEDFVIYVANRFLLWWEIKLTPGKANRSWTETFVRVLGYCWAVGWLCFTWPMLQDGLSVIGYNNVDRGHISQFLSDAKKRWTSSIA